MERIKHEEQLKMREMPQVQAAEGRLLLYGGDKHRVESIIDQLSVELFEIRPRDIRFAIPDVYWDYPENAPERLRIDQSCDEYDDQFVTGEYLTDDETMWELARLGLDFSDERGHPLRCTKALARAAEAAVKGIKGKLPDRDSATLKKFEDALTRDRDAFMSQKRKSRTK